MDGYSEMQEMIDFILSSYGWYRKLIGGEWYQISVPVFDGDNLMWIRASKLNPDLKWTVEMSEDYRKKDIAYTGEPVHRKCPPLAEINSYVSSATPKKK